MFRVASCLRRVACLANIPPARSFSGPTRRGLVERLEAGEHVICAEGYLLLLARMGYLASGAWVPEFILDQPEVLRNVHKEFVHAGTDVTEAFQFYTHREKMLQIGREGDLERINRTALKVAREVALESGTLFAGGISLTNLYKTGDRDAEKKIEAMFQEQVRWSKEEGVDYIIAETLSYLGEAEIALDVIKSFNLPAVVCFAVPYSTDGSLKTLDGIPVSTACRKMIQNGAVITGTNCFRGPETMLPVVEEIIKDVPPNKVCALPLAYRTSTAEPTFFNLTDKCCPENNPVYPHGLDPFYVSDAEIVKFTKRCMELGLKYIGLCCGNTGSYTRAMAETLGRTPPASRYHDLSNMGLDPVKRLQNTKS